MNKVINSFKFMIGARLPGQNATPLGGLLPCRNKYTDWRMARDAKRRRVVKEYARLRLNINSLRKNDILPKSLQVSLDFGGTSKRQTPAAALSQTAAAFLDEMKGSTLLFIDGSVLPATGQGAAALVAPQLNATRTCRLPFPRSSTAAELAGLHLAADLIVTIAPGPVAVLCGSRPALQLLSRPHENVATTSLLRARLQTLEDAAPRQLSTGVSKLDVPSRDFVLLLCS
ncbi:hypothetical protein V5799_000326 [Amblyomma americanum]|uniref:Uncharacterized protein n=1 Tax=Amblyomma americanum TaxID=6943 RepID=A0AAQ4D3D4_AMBAM